MKLFKKKAPIQPKPIQDHVKPYVGEGVTVRGETLYRLTEWAHKPITFDHPTFTRKNGDKVKCWKAFKCGDTEIWTCDPGDLPSFRYRKWALTYEEWSMGLTNEFLDDFLKKMDNAFSGKQRDQEKALMAITEMRYRRRLVRSEDIMYKLISLVYFTPTEDLSDYNFLDQAQKIEMFKKFKEPHDFFFDKRMMELIGLDFESKDTLKKWMQGQKFMHLMLKRGLFSAFEASLEEE